jgi:hypothetical protein
VAESDDGAEDNARSSSGTAANDLATASDGLGTGASAGDEDATAPVQGGIAMSK